MRFLITYVCVANGERTERYAQRFTSTWRQNPPGHGDFRLCVVMNGGALSTNVSRHFEGLSPEYFLRDNSGHDIRAYIDVANHDNRSDFMLCCGQSIWFHRPGWLARLNEVCSQHGPGMYGFYASNLISKHLNTTAFAVTPALLRGWNQRVETNEQRYAYEHHPQNSFWRQVEALGLPVRLVMWDYDLAPRQWRSPPVEGEFWRGTQEQVLFKCSHTDRFDNAVKGTRTVWTRNADHGLPVHA